MGRGNGFHHKLYQWVRVSEDREATSSAAVLDSQSVETATMISQQVGYDSAKQGKGRKRHLLVDTLGLVMMVVVTAASVPERDGAKQVFARLAMLQVWFGRLVRIWVDSGYRGEDFMRWVMDTYHWIVEVIARPDNVKGFVIIPRRWVVERTFGWFNWYRRLSKDYAVLPETAEAFIYVGMIRLMLKRLA